MPRSGLPGSSIVGAHPCGRPIGINLRNYPSPSVGAREDDVGLGGPSWSPVGMGCAARSSRSQQGRGPRSHPRRVTMKVTPTDHRASCLSSWLRLMPIGVPLRSPWHRYVKAQADLLCLPLLPLRALASLRLLYPLEVCA